MPSRPSWTRPRSTFRAPVIRDAIGRLTAILALPETWSDHQKYSEASRETSRLKAILGPVDDAIERLAFWSELSSLGDALLEGQISTGLEDLERNVDGILASPDDNKALFLTISAGSGGHEACAWVMMLLRMYDKYARRQGLKFELMDMDPYEPDGLRTVTVRISGEGAFNAFRTEAGVHRLSRVSPYDQADRRQTSFAKIEVVRESEEKSSEIDVLEEDCDISTCCGGGAGGQKINKTECVVRIKHIPTGVWVRCQAGRGQAYNRKIAMKILASKLTEMENQRIEAERKAKRDASPKAAFGEQYRRTYVLSQHPKIQDHLTGKNTFRVSDVLNGDLSDLV